MWNPLAGMTKVAIAGTIAGGILISGISWQGDTAVETTKQAIDTMESRLITAMADNAFLRSQFESLNQAYVLDIGEANQRIKDLKDTRVGLQAQINDLTAQIEADTASDQTAKTEIQNEINRLEGELDRANQQIAGLEAHALETVNDVNNQYTAVDQSAYQVVDQVVESARNWTESANLTTAQNYSEQNIAIMRDETNLQTMENYYASIGRSITFVGITTYVKPVDGTIHLAWVVQPDNSNLNGYTAEVNNILRGFSPQSGSVKATDEMFFINEAGQLVGTQQLQ